MRHPLTIDSIIGAQWDCRTTCLTKVSWTLRVPGYHCARQVS
jgi:hypothetical protein